MKNVFSSVIQKYSGSSLFQTVKMFGCASIFLFLYMTGYFATWMLDMMFFLFAMYLSLNCLYSGIATTNMGGSPLTSVVKIWVTYGFITSLTQIPTLICNYFMVANFFIVEYAIDILKIYEYYLLLSGKLSADYVSNILLLIYKTNKKGLDSLVDITSRIINNFVINLFQMPVLGDKNVKKIE